MRILAVVFLLSLMPALAWPCARFPQPKLPVVPLQVQTPAGPLVIQAELAQTAEQRDCGLMGRPAMHSGTGMLFDMRPAGPAHFWMKNTPEPLDILFFDGGGQLIAIARNTTPFSEEPVGTDRSVAAVLELAAGEAARLGIGAGAVARLPWLKR